MDVEVRENTLEDEEEISGMYPTCTAVTLLLTVQGAFLTIINTHIILKKGTIITYWTNGWSERENQRNKG